jgi:hypothetical protein
MLLCAGILLWQLFLPGFIGMANNADFGKVAGPLSIGGADNGANNFIFFQSQYMRGPRYYYIPQPPSSEIALAWVASCLALIVEGASRFDIRWLAAVHSAIFLGFFYTVLIVLRPLRTPWRLLLALVALWIFADVGTLAYFNSFYSDVAAILGALAASILAVRLIQARNRPLALALFGMAALLFVTSKGQHGLLGFLPALGVLPFGWALPQWRVRCLAAGIAAVVIAGSIWILAAIPDWYGAEARFNIIFFYITPNSVAPVRDLVELGLDEHYLRYVGMHAFAPGSPLGERAFVTTFCARNTYGRLLGFYLRHPGVAGGKVWKDLREVAWERRPNNLSNFQPDAGRPPGARSTRLASWGALRSRLFRWWPAHILLWYAIALVVLPIAGIRAHSPFRRTLGWVIGAIALAGAAEFLVASLGDAAETYRHLLIFHLLTDMTILLALLFALTTARFPAKISP